MKQAWLRLFASRKFWLAVVALIQSVIFAWTNFPKELWLSIDALLVAVIITIAVEDAAMKRAGLEYTDIWPVLKKLIYSRKVWLAFVGVLQTFIFYYIPNFPQEVWLSINGVLIVVIAGIATEDAALHLSRG